MVVVSFSSMFYVYAHVFCAYLVIHAQKKVVFLCMLVKLLNK